LLVSLNHPCTRISSLGGCVVSGHQQPPSFLTILGDYLPALPVTLLNALDDLGSETKPVPQPVTPAGE